jgi:ribosomal protein L16 Arg81 hydroxylase
MLPSFEWLIDPISPARFFQDYYEHKPLVVEGPSAKFASLLSMAEIDRFLATTTPYHPDVFLTDAARELKFEDFTVAGSEPSGRIDLARAYQLFGTGATIVLNQMQERLPQLADLCRAAERTFSHHFQTNIYLSPPNAQGFKTHFDSHDVFVLQVSGSKHWTIYDTLIELPLAGQGFEPEKHVAGAPTREIVLKAGDLFYCPRGLFHSARSTDEASLHITLGLIGKTWADVLTEALSEACLQSPAFRANLPAGFANMDFDSSKAEAAFRALLETFASNARLQPILGRFAETFVTTRRPDLRGCLEELGAAPQISAETRVGPRPHLVFALREENQNLVLVFGPTQIKFPSFAREDLEAALREPFIVRDFPGRLDEAGKLALARRLVKEGILIRLRDPDEGASPTRRADAAHVPAVALMSLQAS